MNKQTQPTEAQLAEYRALLKAHDWTFEYSEDQTVWRRGGTELARLRELQKRLDPKYEVWNEVAPRDFRR